MPQRTIRLQPAGTLLTVPDGSPLQDVLFDHGVEFPCGGRGLCKGCRVRILRGSLAIQKAERDLLSAEELKQGWRLACMGKAESDLTLELAQWEASILGDDSHFEFEPREGGGIAIDLGTTTVAAQLLDLRAGNVLAVETALNLQARHGADILSRIEYAMAGSGREELTGLIREQIGDIVSRLIAQADNPPQVRTVMIGGNTVMHHLFCGLSLAALSHYPFETNDGGMAQFSGNQLGWSHVPDARVTFLPCPGGFVGSDILAGILATGMHKEKRLCALLDLGTNGEIVVGTGEKLMCASTAAGPAFEGARISCGMRAATGAIAEVSVWGDELHCRVLGHAAARGICGSGLVDAVAGGLELKRLTPRGRLLTGATLPLTGSVELTQWDIRELQMAKGAIAAGLRVLLREWGGELKHLECLYLGGAFGNYINLERGRRIGLLQAPVERIKPVGNSALHGLKRMLFLDPEAACAEILGRLKHVSLHDVEGFQDAYVDEMSFPGVT